jgi:hypothetical protein
MGASSPLQVTDATRAEASSFGQLLLNQPGSQAVLAKQVTEAQGVGRQDSI